MFAAAIAFARAPALTPESEIVRLLEAALTYAEAVARLEALLRAEPRNLPAYFFLATAYQSRQNYAGCLEQIRRAAAQAPLDDRLYGIRWVCQSESGDAEAACRTAAEAVGLFPNSAEAHRWQGVSLLQAKQLPQARHHFEEALRRDAEDATALYLLAQLYRREGDTIPSLLAYLRFFTVEPGGSRAAKAREQWKPLFEARLDIRLTGPGAAEISLEPAGGGRASEYAPAERALATYVSPTGREPSLTPAKFAAALGHMVAALPKPAESGPGAFPLTVLAPYLAAAQREGQLRGLAELSLSSEPEPSPAAAAYQRWAASYRWPAPATR